MDYKQRITTRAKLAAGIDKKSALYDLYPDLESRVPVFSGEATGQEYGPRGGFKFNAGYYESQVWLHKAVKVIKDNLAPLPVIITEGSPEDKKPINSPVADLLKHPNDEMDPAQLWAEWATDLLLGGEHGQEMVWNRSKTQILEIWPRQPDTIFIMPGNRRYREVRHYKIDDRIADPYNLDPAQMVHHKFYNPLQPYRGLSPVGAVRSGILIDQLVRAWSHLFFRNNARPDLAIIAPEGITKTEKEELLKELFQDHRGKPHGPIVLESGVTDIKTFSHQRKDVEWLAQMEMSREEVGAVLGIPDEIMGFGRDTYENFGHAMTFLWTITLSPLFRLRDSTMTRFFRAVNLLSKNQQVETVTRNIPELEPDRTAKVDQLDRLAGRGYPVNVLSRWLGLNLPAVPGGDVGFLPFAVQPATEAARTGQETRTWRGWSSRSVAQSIKAPAFGSAEHRRIWLKQQADQVPHVRAMTRALKKYFQDQQNDISKRVRDSRDLGRGKYKGLEKTIPIDSIFDMVFWVDEFKRRFGPIIDASVQDIGDIELANLGLNVDFQITVPETAAAIDLVLRTVATKTNDTTWLGLIQLFQDAELAGEGIPAIMERLSAYFGDRKSDWQTERIARTTMTGSTTLGQQEAWKQSGVPLKKTWLSALQSGRSRPEHMAAHGQTVDIDSAFEVGGEMLDHPGDPNGTPGNIINCLCSMMAEVQENN